MDVTLATAWIAIGALCGAGIGWERASGNYRFYDQQGPRVVMLIWLAAVAWGWSTTWHGFAYLLLMPIGAYKAADVIVTPIARPIADRLRWRRQDREAAATAASPPRSPASRER